MKLEDFKEDYNWSEAFEFAPFNINNVIEVIASDEGENDGESWVCVVKLNDGTFGFVDAWCDYTGWDCQSGGSGYQDDDFEHLKRWKMNSSARRRLGMELPDLDEIPNRK